ncbi:MAG: ECF transporter S component, partial [Agromyces sp.]
MNRTLNGWLAIIASSVAAGSFCWPLLAATLPNEAQSTTAAIAIGLLPVLALFIVLLLDRELASTKHIALLGVLAALGAAVRIATTGIGGVEAVFIVLILGGRAFGARFGFLLGMLTIAVSSLVWGGVGPWTAFQMFAAGWVGAGAGLLPRNSESSLNRAERRREIGILIAYGVGASYLFGALMNLWFWPFGVGPQTDVSYLAGADVLTNLARFSTYTLLTS